MKWSGNADQVLREIGEDAPVVRFIGVRLGRASNPTTESHVVELAAHRSQTRLDVAETLAVSELSEGHRQILIPARQTSVVLIAVIAGHTLLELEVGEMSDQLRENGSASIHPPLFRRCGVQQFSTLSAVFSSNRFWAECQLFYGWQSTCQTSQSTLPDTSDWAWIGVSARGASMAIWGPAFSRPKANMNIAIESPMSCQVSSGKPMIKDTVD